MKRILTHFTVATVMFFAWISDAGNERGNSIDDLREEDGTAWFLGSSAVKYCIEIAPDFGPDLNEAKDDIFEAFKKWKDYIDAVPRFKNPKHAAIVPAAQGRYQDHCDGNQDLTFYLGAESKEVSQVKRDTYHPTAFVHRTQFNPNKGWSKGYVWVSKIYGVDYRKQFPNWDDRYTFYGVILHELGHIFGCSHTQGTIMSADLNEMIKEKDESVRQHYLTRIDGNYALFPCVDCENIYPGVLLADPQTGAIDESLAKEIFGDSAVRAGEIARARVQIGALSTIKKLEIVFLDKSGTERVLTVDIQDQAEGDRTAMETGEQVFAAIYPWSAQGKLEKTYYPRIAYVDYGTVQTGKNKWMAVVERNINSRYSRSAFVVKLFINGKIVPLFRSTHLR